MKKIFELINNIRHAGFIPASLRYRDKCGMTIFGQNGMMSVKKVVAFTLAETLIVMGIIGIVSALTLPNLNSSTGEKEKVAKVKKIYQNLTDAFGRAEAVYGPVEEWFTNDATVAAQTTRFKDRMTEFMKVSKDCGSNTGCWSTAKFKWVDGDEESNYYQELKTQKFQFVILADGTALAFFTNGGNFDVASKIHVDIDGPTKGKTQEGVDIFDFSYQTEYNRITGIIPSFFSTNGGASDSSPDSNVTAWVVQNENLDYLKCADKLNWDTKTSCK